MVLSLTAATDAGGASFLATNIGNPTIPGSATSVAGGYDVTGAGTNLGGMSDQFFFDYQSMAGDFDVQVRIATLSQSDAWAKAGLMARATLNTNSLFGAALATPSLTGCLFQSRADTNASATMSGSFAVNYPYTYLRLQRTNGSTLTGYAGLDGNLWVRLGSMTNTSLPSTLFVGFALCGNSSTTPATAQMRDYGAVSSATEGLPARQTEPLGMCSRKTGLVISEIMYHPRAVTLITNATVNSLTLEFIEIYNSQPYFEDIGGFSLAGDVDYTFPPNTIMPAGGFLVLAKVPADVQAYYGLSHVLGYGVSQAVTNVAGGVTNITTNIVNSLSNSGGRLRLLNRAKAVLLEVNYSSQSPWPTAADGAGHSLVLARPSYGEGDPRAWAASDSMGGSPGGPDPIGPEPARAVVINEFLANSDPPLEDFVELYNHSNVPVDLSGCYLSDSPATTKFRIPDGTIIPARGFASFTETQMGFALSASGEKIFLVNSNQTRVLDAIAYEAQSSGISFGRCPDGAATWRALAARTPGAANSSYKESDIVINEIMYGPISGDANDQYVELYNKGTNPVALGGWSFIAGITFAFPSNTVLAPNQYMVVAKNAARLMTNYSNLSAANLVGNFGGSLAHKGERLALARPELQISTDHLGRLVTNTILVVANEVTYDTSEKWGVWADAGGSSLELMDPRSDNRLSDNWADSNETGKSQWASYTMVGTIGETLGSPVNDNLEIFLLGVGECLIDNVEVDLTNAVNLLGTSGTFEAGMTGWAPQGSHDWSVIENEGYGSAKSLHVKAASRGDNGANRLHSAAFTTTPLGPITFKANARWLRGYPEVLLRIHGGGLEMSCRLPVPKNLGTPGAPNSRAITNAGPAISEVIHQPALPAAGQPVVVTARVHDPDGLASLSLKYRQDLTINSPSPASFTTVPMKDDGTGGDALAGDGVYSATIPAQAAGTVVAFYLEAVDRALRPATNVFPRNALTPAFPSDAPTHECVVRFGEVQMPGSFPTYHVWLTMVTSNRWANRDHLNNSLLDATFVYNDCRVIYNEMPNYGGSPWHRGQMTTGPAGDNRVDFAPVFPNDEPFLGATDATWCNPGNPGGSDFSDHSMQSEQTSYILFREIGLHANYRRYMHLFINGNQRSTIPGRSGNMLFEDGQQPNGDIVQEWYPDDSNGELYKIEDWFEFDDNGYDFSNNNDADLSRRTNSVNGFTELNPANIRFMFRHRAISPWESASDYTNLFALVDAVSPASNPTISPIQNVAQVEGLANIEQWMRIFACQHTVGNWDSYGFSRGKNDFMYKGLNGRYEQMTWDIDFTMGLGGNAANDSIFQANDPRISALWATPAFVRYYWRAFQDIVNGPLNNSFLDPILDAKAAAMAANNINYDPDQVATIKSYTLDRRNYLISQLATVAGNFTFNGGAVLNLTSNLATFTGSAPVQVQTIRVNGIAYPITWTSVKNWTINVPLAAGTNLLVFQTYDRLGNLIATNATFTNTAIVNISVPDARNAIVINEIMFAPAVPNAEFVELLNTATNYTFDLSGWVFKGLSYTFPSGSFIPPRSCLALVKDRFACVTAYGNSLPIFDVFPGNLQSDGETLTLIKPGATPDLDVVVDQVRYEGALPWNTNAVGTGSSLQLIDPLQDNSRPGNWFSAFVPLKWTDPIVFPGATNVGWHYVQSTGLIRTNSTNAIYMDSKGDVYLDDISLVVGSDPNVGPNLLQNGDFEGPFAPAWQFWGTNLTNSAISTNLAHSGRSSLHVVSTGPAGPTKAIVQSFPTPATNATCTLSYWFYSSTNGNNLTVRTYPVPSIISTTNVQPTVIPPSYTPGQFTLATNYLSPGAANPVATNLPYIPPLWLNEAQPENINGLTDALGHHAPWLELYNAGTNVESLTGLYLANTYTNLTQWAFPAGATIQPGEFKIIFADGATAESALSELHTSFALNPGSGSLALSRLYKGQPQVLDYLNYSGVPPNSSYGSWPDGQLFTRQIFYYASPGHTNDRRSAPIVVYINEWMANNTRTVADPADGKFQDWFELFNPGPGQADLSGYYLTRDLTVPLQYQIPPGYVIPPGGFLLVWADNETTQNSSNRIDLHVNFKLTKSGTSIGLFAADGTPVNTVTFGQQIADLSQGHYPDGTGPIYAKMNPTPRMPNLLPPSATPPQLGDVVMDGSGSTLSFSFMGYTGTIYRIEYKDDLGAAAWTPLATYVGSNSMIVVTDTLSPIGQRFYRVVVQ